MCCSCLCSTIHVYFQRVRLHFTKFRTRYSRHVVSIYNGTDANAPLINRLSGSGLPGNITSSGNTVFLYFTTDYHYRDIGFTIEYSAFGGKFNIVLKCVLPHSTTYNKTRLQLCMASAERRRRFGESPTFLNRYPVLLRYLVFFIARTTQQLFQFTVLSQNQ